MLTKEAKSPEVLAALKQQGIEVGLTPRIFALDKTSQEGKISVYVIGMVKSTSSGGFSAFEQAAYGQVASPERAKITFDQEMFDALGLGFGSELVINGIVGAIKVIETTTPQFMKKDGTPQSPRLRRTADGNMVPAISETGTNIYRTTQIVTMEELDQDGHVYIPRKKEVAQQQQFQQQQVNQQQQFQQPPVTQQFQQPVQTQQILQ